MLPEAFVEHRIDHRVRIKIPSRRGDTNYFESLRSKFSHLGKYEDIRINPVTGSILIVHDENDLVKIADYAEADKLFSLVLNGSVPAPLARKVADPIESLSRYLNRFTGGDIDLPGLIFILLLGFGVIEILRGRFRTPPWYTAFWYAFGVFSKSVVDKRNSGYSEENA